MPTAGGGPGRGALADRVRGSWRVLVRELSAFGVVGAASFVVDLAVFQAVYAGVGADAVVAKLVSTVVSTSTAFAGHRWWSFSTRARTGLRREYLAFAAVNAVTLLIGLGIVALVHHGLGQESSVVLLATNVFSIVVGTVIRFVAYRAWVFPAAPAPVAPDAAVGVLTR
ncbi:GtrA family protein [Geodermatophilus saharensis]|uniref:GtrA family protein n=1 Tax=Geodermatophilus saharensis TaxID=1137994 RepID=UPI001FE49CA2|nr:GtrA family protein [Geodermatophilus saharensis]